MEKQALAYLITDVLGLDTDGPATKACAKHFMHTPCDLVNVPNRAMEALDYNNDEGGVVKLNVQLVQENRNLVAMIARGRVGRVFHAGIALVRRH